MDVLGKDERIRDDTDAVRAFNGVIAAAKCEDVSVAKYFNELTEDFAYLRNGNHIRCGYPGGGECVADTRQIRFGTIPSIERGSGVRGEMNKYIVSATLACLQRSLAVGEFKNSNEEAVTMAKAS